MSDAKPSQVLRMPSDEQMQVVFEAYALALGKVAYAWNDLQEQLARFFVVVVTADEQVARAIWDATRNDRTQQQMLKSAVAVGLKDHPRCKEARADIQWLVDKADSLQEHRNNAVHGPSWLVTGSEGIAMSTALQPHPRSKKLADKNLLHEFEW